MKGHRVMGGEAGDLLQLEILLPPFIVSKSDIDRLLNNLEEANDFFLQAELRSPGKTMSLPRTTKSLDDFMKLNNQNILSREHREAVIRGLKKIFDQAPSLHISFSVDPSQKVIHQILSWLRANVHPYLLLGVGLQPNIGAGCIIRGNSTYFDLSLRRQLVKNKALIIDRLDSPSNNEPESVSTPDDQFKEAAAK